MWLFETMIMGVVCLGIFLRKFIAVYRGEDETDDEVRSATSSSSPRADGSEILEFDVFLTFRGSDTRKGFTGHLYDWLRLKGVSTFMDSIEVRKGDQIEKIFESIEKSNVCVAIISKGYADSSWCLREITKMVECRKRIIPLFFGVEPSDVREQSGPFAAAFKRHRSTKRGGLNRQEVRKWKDALNKVGKISGHSLKDTEGHESKLLKVIVKGIMSSLVPTLLDVAEHPVGLESRVDDVKRMLSIKENDVRMIGICGMGGMGKTTLAKAVYNEISSNFADCSFIANVRETSRTNGLESLQNQLVRDIFGGREKCITSCSRGNGLIRRAGSKKVLLILDDVDDRNQLKALAQSCDWFGKGSRVIITTRDKKILTLHGIEEDQIYLIQGLNTDHSMELFCYHAFRSKQPPTEEYGKLTKQVLLTTNGLPLSLEIVGSEFFDAKTPQEWKDLLKKLGEYQNGKVHERLRISYDGLDPCEKQVFLDIACFFIGRDAEYPTRMWEACGFHPSVTLKVLEHKSLIKITKGRRYAWEGAYDTAGLEIEKCIFQMHEQIREMGRTIVLQEIFLDPPRRTRVWDATTKEVQTIEIPTSVQGILFEEMIGGGTTTTCMWNPQYNQLRYLYIHGVKFAGAFQRFPTKSLRWLSLYDCKFEQPPSHFDLGGTIIILDLSGTLGLARTFVEQSLETRRKAVEQLMILDLSWTDITTTPDFTNVPCPCLEQLIICDCRRLMTVHESIGELKKLVSLQLRDCWDFSSLPNTLGGATSLKKLVLQGTGIQTLPDSVECLTNLHLLSLRGCYGLKALSCSLRKLCSLEVLDIAFTQMKCLRNYNNYIENLMDTHVLDLPSCELLYVLPDHFWLRLTNLVLADPEVEALPESFGKMKKLVTLSLRNCKNLKVLPSSIGQMESLVELYLDCEKLATLPDCISTMPRLSRLHLSGCHNLSSSLLGIPASLFHVCDSHCTSLETEPSIYCSISGPNRIHKGTKTVKPKKKK